MSVGISNIVPIFFFNWNKLRLCSETYFHMISYGVHFNVYSFINFSLLKFWLIIVFSTSLFTCVYIYMYVCVWYIILCYIRENYSFSRLVMKIFHGTFIASHEGFHYRSVSLYASNLPICYPKLVSLFRVFKFDIYNIHSSTAVELQSFLFSQILNENRIFFSIWMFVIQSTDPKNSYGQNHR